MELLRVGLLVATLLIAVYTDLYQRKIFNWNTFPAIGLGFGLALGEAFSEGQLVPALPSAFGFALCALIFALPAYLGWLGGGDYKLLLGIGALQGSPLGGSFVFQAIYNISLIGAVMALLLLIWRGNLLEGLKRCAGLLVRPKVKDIPESEQLPYGLAIGLGTLWTLWGVLH